MVIANTVLNKKSSSYYLSTLSINASIHVCIMYVIETVCV